MSNLSTLSVVRPEPLQCRGGWCGSGPANAQKTTWSRPANTRPDGSPSGGDADLRVSDVERQATADQLKSHFASGRLDMNEYEERLGQALAARSRRDLDDLLKDLPPTTTTGVRVPRPPLPFLVPLLFAAALVAVFTMAFGVLHWFFFPWWVVPTAFFLLSRYRRRGWRATGSVRVR